MTLAQWEQDPALKMVCKDCTAECCKHIAVPIDPPTSWEDFQRIKWYVCHEGVSCYLDVEGDWVVEFITKCGQLNGNRCMAWGTKEYPSICAEYDMKTCVMNEEGDYWEVLFKTPEDVDAHCKKMELTGSALEIHEPCVRDVDAHCKKMELTGSALEIHEPCVSVPLDTPEDLKDFDDMRWYIAHRDVTVYKKDTWFVHFNTLCKLSCNKKDSHIPTNTETHVALRSWKDVAAYCEQHKIPAPAQPTGKEALKIIG